MVFLLGASRFGFLTIPATPRDFERARLGQIFKFEEFDGVLT
jgi:hypothetical protein